jgi:hypothetical protein
MVQKNDVNNPVGFQVSYDGLVQLQDVRIEDANRTTTATSALRKDEILGHVLGALSFRSSEQNVANTGFPIGAIRAWHKRDAPAGLNLTFALLGGTDAQPSLKSMEQAPDGTYVIFSVRLNKSNGLVQVRDSDFFVKSHTQGNPTQVFQYGSDSDNNSYFGWVMRIA